MLLITLSFCYRIAGGAASAGYVEFEFKAITTINFLYIITQIDTLW